MTGAFQEIAETERIVFTSGALDADGNLLFEVLNTVIFEEQAGKTKLTLHASVSKIKPQAAGHLAGTEQGWSQSLDRLASEVASPVS